MSFEAFGLYVHIPYCRTKCPYCDFNVRAGASWPEARYVDALVAELRHYAARPPFAGKRIATIFLGGGTPSLFAAESIARLLDAARSAFESEADIEISETSLEANPDALDVRTLAGYRAAGVDRLSIGIESFAPHVLKRLGRLQTASDTDVAVARAREAGFTNVSIDLMFAVPGQSLDDWRSDLDRAIAFAPEHVSAYNLTYEQGTPFFDLRAAGKIAALDDDVEAAMFEESRERLGRAGYRAYEVSNFARPGFESRHNLSYWRTGAYLGIGAGAHSHEPLARGARRWANEKDADGYLRRTLADGAAVATEETLAVRAAAGEFVFLGLRMSEGFSAATFRARFGSDLEGLFPDVERMVAEGFLERRPEGRVALTARGLLVADSVFASFL